MYFVNRSEIEEILTYFDRILLELNHHQLTKGNIVSRLALERMVQILIESILDVGNKMIDGFIMRDPGSYEDIIAILTDEKVLSQEDEEKYIQFIQLRQMIVQNYFNVDHDETQAVLRQCNGVLQQFSAQILDYLDTELGVANTFSNEDHN